MSTRSMNRLPVVNMTTTFFISGPDNQDIATAEVQIAGSPPGLYITNLRVSPEYRKQGLGTMLLQAILQVYGEETLCLVVQGFGSGLTNAELTDWYKSYGFEPVADAPCLMIRQPALYEPH